jgi:hypothetical protein
MERRLPGAGFRLLDARTAEVEVAGEADRERAAQDLLLACAVASRLLDLPAGLPALASDLVRWHGRGDSRMVLNTRYLLAGRPLGLP